MLALRSLNAARDLAPQHPLVHQHAVALRHSLGPVLETLSSKVQEVLNAEFTAVSPSADLKKSNLDFRAQHSGSAPHTLAALRVDRLLGVDRAKCEQGAVEILKSEDSTIDDASSVLETLKEWGADLGGFKTLAQKRWPHATSFA